MPFRLPHRKEQLLVDCLAKVAGAFNPVNLTLDGFGHFRDRVIFVKVKPNEQLDDLFKALGRTMRTTFTLFNGDYKGRGFNPHLTLAFRDLKRSAFKQAWSDFEERVYTRQFISRSLTLLKHNGKYWIISKDFSFN